MMFGVRTSLIAAALVVAGVAQASAGASLVDVNGPVLVNTGNGFQQASATSLKAGDRVLVRNGGKAVLSYEDGCRVDLNVGTAVTVANASPCVSSTAQISTPAIPTSVIIGGMAAGGIGIGVAIAQSNDSSTSTPTSP
ncbi:hypothetical protein [Ancylobacter lacus]|uniref:hypothetical protein n=1 Tax=Ancylobacter lacus TaxID=2579970 RepID=UPI001BD12CE9|nr:hypothetical protein [Ancylobacter lacus]MBS7539995.1 hypothetical protein [Ancylobacter lacus]